MNNKSGNAEFDVIVVGGSYAGLSAALQLARARCRVLVIDANRRRNRYAHRSHGFLTQDGSEAAAIAADGRAQLQAYPTVAWANDTAIGAVADGDGFRITLGDGGSVSGQRLVLATGVVDTLPPVDGLQERWGKSVFHCPYCHGYELDQGEIGVIAAVPMSIHQAQLLPEWGTVTFLLNEAIELDAAAREELVARGVRIEETPIARIEGHADVVLADARRLSFAGLFTASLNAPSTPIAQTLGCALMETPMGTQLQTSDAKETSVEGVFACGDVARMPHSVSLAVADGAWAGAQIHRTLVWPTAG